MAGTWHDDVSRSQLIIWLLIASKALEDVRREDGDGPCSRIAGVALRCVPNHRDVARIGEVEPVIEAKTDEAV